MPRRRDGGERNSRMKYAGDVHDSCSGFDSLPRTSSRKSAVLQRGSSRREKSREKGRPPEQISRRSESFSVMHTSSRGRSTSPNAQRESEAPVRSSRSMGGRPPGSSSRRKSESLPVLSTRSSRGRSTSPNAQREPEMPVRSSRTMGTTASYRDRPPPTVSRRVSAGGMVQRSSSLPPCSSGNYKLPTASTGSNGGHFATMHHGGNTLDEDKKSRRRETISGSERRSNRLAGQLSEERDPREVLPTFWRSRDPGRLWKHNNLFAPIKLYIGTWDMGGCSPPPDLTGWLHPGSDMYFIALQGVTYYTKHGCPEDSMRNRIEDAIGHGYDCVGFQASGGIVAMCVAKSSVKAVCHSTRCSSYIEKIGGKTVGGVGMSFWIGDISLAFVSSSFSGPEEDDKVRNRQFAEILANLSLGMSGLPSIVQHTYTVWAGHLNYGTSSTREDAMAMIERGDIKTLAGHDNLRNSKKDNKAFANFKEPPRDFLPTGEYESGSQPNEEGMRPYSQNCVPHWPDRIMTHSLPGTRFEYHRGSYASVPSITTSAHSPVLVRFKFQVPNPTCLIDNSSKSPLRVRISNLNGNGLATDEGISSLYVRVIGWFSEKSAKTSIQSSTSSPAWKNDVLELEPCRGIDDVEWLQTRHVIFAVFDDDLGSDDLIASGVLPLSGMGTQPSEFLLHLANKGVPAGVLKGDVEICWLPEAGH